MLKSKQGAFQIVNSVEMFKPLSKFTKQARSALDAEWHVSAIGSLRGTDYLCFQGFAGSTKHARAARLPA